MKGLYKFSLFLLIACSSGKFGNTSSHNCVVKEVKKTKAKNIIPKTRDSVIVEGAIGLVLTSENYDFGDTINIFDEDEQVQSRIFIEDENQKLTLKCLSIYDLFYKVQFENNKIGFILKSEQGIIFQTWEEHILRSVFAVSFNEINNPILESPFESIKKVSYNKDEYYHPNRIEGDWLQIKWGSESDWKYGWIKWKEGEKLIVVLFYFA